MRIIMLVGEFGGMQVHIGMKDWLVSCYGEFCDFMEDLCNDENESVKVHIMIIVNEIGR